MLERRQSSPTERFLNMPTRSWSSSRGDVPEVTRKAAISGAQDPSDIAGNETALLVSPFSEDHQLLTQIFIDRGWTLHLTHTLGSALAVLRDRPIPVVIADALFRAGTGETFLLHGKWCHTIRFSSSPPDLRTGTSGWRC